MKQENNSLLYSLLLSQNRSEEHEVTWEDLMYLHCPEVNRCQTKVYTLVIECLSKGMSYEEINSFIDNLDIEEYKKLTQKEKVYIKTRVKRDLNSRKNNETKNRGVINNE